jgi:sorbitol/mannitol transport system substrate-binding protein
MNRNRVVVVLLTLAFCLLAGAYSFAGGATETEESAVKEPVTISIATVNNPDMKVMQELSTQFTEETGIKLNWSILPENELRQKVIEDVGLGAGKFDIVTIGILEVKSWVNYEWIVPLDPFFEQMGAAERKAYDLDDVLQSVREGLSVDGKLYALPFYGETSIVYYRKDLFEKAGLTMPEEPSWDQMQEFAEKLHDPDNGVYGLVLRGLPGWGENMAVFATMINAFGARWYDMNWKAQFNTPEMRNAFETYYKLIKSVCEPGATGIGFTEGLTLMAQGKGAIWYDASVGAGLLNDTKQSKVAGKLGYARAPWAKKHDNGWLWSWALSMESASKHKDEAFKFLTWATSKKYIELVGETKGWVTVPSGSRESTYKNPKYRAVADFAPLVLDAMKAVDYNRPALEPTPYIGTPFVVFPEWPHLGTEVAQILAAYISDKVSLDEALDQCQKIADKVAVEGGYQKK